jgi:replicative DNA helicase
VNEPIAAHGAEKLVVGNILRNPDLIFEARQSLDARDFHDSTCRQLYILCCELSDKGRRPSQDAVLQYIQDRKLSGSMLIAATMDCHDTAMTRSSLTEFATEVLESSMLRKVALMAEELLSSIESRQGTAEDLIADADRRLLEIAGNCGNDAQNLEQQSYDAMASIDEQRSGKVSPCYPTGLRPLDEFLGGLGKGELTVLGGRPSMGKSSMVLQVVIENCLRGNFCHVFSIEMTAEQLLRRIYAVRAKVPFHRVRHPERMTPEELAIVRRASLEVSAWPLVIDDTPDLTVEQLIARARVSKRKNKAAIVAVDYLQKLRFGKKLDMRHLEVTNAAVALAKLAKSEQIAVLLLSSLTENKSRNRNDPPTLSDFRQSGDIAFEAHNALLLHRTVDDTTQSMSNDGFIIVAKARADRTGNLEVRFNTDTLLFEDPKSESRYAM